MSTIAKRNVPLAITFILTVLLIYEWFFPTDIGASMGKGIREAGIIIAAFAVMSAAVQFYLGRFKRLARREQSTTKDTFYNIWMLFIATIFILLGVTYGSDHSNYEWLYNSVLLPLSATMYGNISWYIAAASYRVLRGRSLQATVLLIAGGVLLLANTPFISSLTLIPSQLGDWLMDNVVQTSYRAIVIGTSLGILANGVRTMIGVETGWLGRRLEEEQ